MRVAAFTDLAGPEKVLIIERSTPEPGPGKEVVDVDAYAISRHDLRILESDSVMVGGDDHPFVSGLDIASTVRDVGADVTDFERGDRVVLFPIKTCGTCRFCPEALENLCESFSLYHGGLAESARVAADRLVPHPEPLDTTTAAALSTSYVTTAHMPRRVEAEPDNLVFVPGVAGGVGIASVQLAEVRGARTISTSSSTAKLGRVADLGLYYAVRGTDPDEIRAAV